MSSVVKSKTLCCPHCRKPCSSQSGLTLHVKNCKKKQQSTIHPPDMNSRSDKATDIDPRISDEEFDVKPFEKKTFEKKPFEKKAPQVSHKKKFGGKGKGSYKPKKGSGEAGAFKIFPYHMPALLDYDFAQALASFILENSCPNPALVAFARQIKSAHNDEE